MGLWSLPVHYIWILYVCVQSVPVVVIQGRLVRSAGSRRGSSFWMSSARELAPTAAHHTVIITVIKTRNAFCGTWYLPHSHVRNEWTVPIGEGVLRYWPLTNSFFLLGFLRLCQFWWKSIKKCDRESARRRTDTLTDWHTDRRKPIL